MVHGFYFSKPKTRSEKAGVSNHKRAIYNTHFAKTLKLCMGNGGSMLGVSRK